MKTGQRNQLQVDKYHSLIPYKHIEQLNATLHSWREYLSAYAYLINTFTRRPQLNFVYAIHYWPDVWKDWL